MKCSACGNTPIIKETGMCGVCTFGTAEALEDEFDTEPTPPPPSCEHSWHRAGYVGMAVVYECSKCGDQYEKDVS